MKKRTTAMVIGLGGIGCPATLSLARLGVGKIRMVDDDCIELSNLPRQLWHSAEDLGKRKTDSAYEKLSKWFPGVVFEPLFLRVGKENAAALFSEVDVVIDATDSAESKLFFSDTVARRGGLLISAGVGGWVGQVMAIRPGGPCLRCIFPSLAGLSPPPEAGVLELRPKLRPELLSPPPEAGVLGPLAGVLGFWAAALAQEAAQEKATEAKRRSTLHWIDARRWRTGILHIERDEACFCSQRS